MAKSLAIFQEKKGSKFLGDKIYFYKTKDKKWYYVRVGSPKRGSVPEYMVGVGQWWSRKDFPTIKSLENYFREDNIFRIK